MTHLYKAALNNLISHKKNKKIKNNQKNTSTFRVLWIDSYLSTRILLGLNQNILESLYVFPKGTIVKNP